MRPEQNTKLYRSYVLHEDSCRVLRHRGKSPRQSAFFFKNAELNFHASQLASLFVMCELLGASDRGLEASFSVGSLESGALLCRAYETYVALHAPPLISFEHAWFLLLALARRDEVSVARCPECDGVQLRDNFARHKLACGACGQAAAANRAQCEAYAICAP